MIGAKPYGLFYPPPPGKGWNVVRLQDQFDAVLYLGGARPTFARLPPALCADTGYMEMRRGRMALDDIRIAKPSVDALNMYCAAQVPK